MAFFTIICAFHETERLLEQTLPLAIQSLTSPTTHDFEIILVADRSSEAVVSRLVARLPELGVDELRFRRSGHHDCSGAPSNNFHTKQFATQSRYLITFTDDSFIWKEDTDFDVLDATYQIFTRHPNVALLSKVDDHDEWDYPLVDVGPVLQSGVRSVNRIVDQFVAYETTRFGPPAAERGAWRPGVLGVHEGSEFQWENLASYVGTTGGRQIALPECWPLRVRHSDIRNQPGSMHGSQDESTKISVFEALMASQGTSKI